MADVQLENGYTVIANTILEQLAKIKLSPMQFRLIFIIWRYTYGFKRKSHDLSLSFLANSTGCDKRQIQRELKDLESRGIIHQKITNGVNRIISFQKDYDSWVGETAIGEMTIGETTNSTIGEIIKGTIGETTNQEIKTKTKSKTLCEKKQKTENPNTNLIKFFSEEYKRKYGNVYLPNWARDGTIIKDFLNGGYTEEFMKKYITWFMDLKDDYLDTNGRSIPLLKSRLDKYNLTLKKSQSKSRDLSNYMPGE